MTTLTPQSLRDLRKARGMSTYALAGLSGCPRSSIENWERGTYPPSPERLRRLAEALGVEGEIEWAGRPYKGYAGNGRAKGSGWPAPRTKPAAGKRARGEDGHTYTIVIRTPREDKHILTTADKDEAWAKYRAMRMARRFPRVIQDGVDLPIYIADKLFTLLTADKTGPLV